MTRVIKNGVLFGEQIDGLLEVGFLNYCGL